jgi:hypothetical protein
MSQQVDLVKALLMQAAATNAAAVCGNTSGGGVPIDPLIQDTGLQGKGVMDYEEAKIQYAALLRAFQDKTGVWPDPKVSDPAPAPSTGAVGPTRLWPVPAPAGDDPERLALRLQVRTRLEMREGQTVVPLSAAEWEERGRQLATLEGSAASAYIGSVGDRDFHDFRTRDAKQDGDAFATLWHLDRLLTAQEGDKHTGNGTASGWSPPAVGAQLNGRVSLAANRALNAPGGWRRRAGGRLVRAGHF